MPHLPVNNSFSVCTGVSTGDFQELDKPCLQQGGGYVKLNRGNILVRLVLAKGHEINVCEQVLTLSKAFPGRCNHSCAQPGPHAALDLKDKRVWEKLID